MADEKTDSVAHFFGGMDAADTDDLNLSLEPTEDDEVLEGELAVDVFQNDSSVVVVSPIAGIDPDQIEISASDDEITISGERRAGYEHKGEHVVTQEIYWGAFKRSIRLPVPCEVDKASADYEHGVLKVTIPKIAQSKKRLIKVKSSSHQQHGG